MQLSKRLNYMTHLPILKSVCDIFLPRGVLELGCGKHSTSFFYDYNEMSVSLETDEKWFNKIKNEYPDKNNFKLIYHNLYGKISKKTAYGSVLPDDLKEVKDFYDGILKEHDLNFLFVDHLSCLRKRSVQHLYERFDIIVYHDAEDKKRQYNYRALDISLDNYYHWIHKSFTTNTGIIISKKYEDKLLKFNKRIKHYGDEFCNSILKKYKHVIKIKG